LTQVLYNMWLDRDDAFHRNDILVGLRRVINDPLARCGAFANEPRMTPAEYAEQLHTWMINNPAQVHPTASLNDPNQDILETLTRGPTMTATAAAVREGVPQPDSPMPPPPDAFSPPATPTQWPSPELMMDTDDDDDDDETVDFDHGGDGDMSTRAPQHLALGVERVIAVLKMWVAALGCVGGARTRGE
jgi:hypothetical protein